MEPGGGRDPQFVTGKENNQRGDSVENEKHGKKPGDYKKSDITINTKPQKNIYNISKSLVFIFGT